MARMSHRGGVNVSEMIESCHNCPWGDKAGFDSAREAPARVEGVFAMMQAIADRLTAIEKQLTRIETLVDINLGKDGTLPELEKKVDGMYTRMIFVAGASTAIGRLLGVLNFPLFK